MVVENITLSFRLRRRDETRNYFLEEWKHNFLVCKKYKKNL